MKRLAIVLTAALFTLAAPLVQAEPTARTLADMVDAGRYDWVSPEITESHFFVKPASFTIKGLETAIFGRRVSTTEALEEIDLHGFRPATIEELLAYGASNPEKQREHLIVALGSSWIYNYQDPRVPYLVGGADVRELNVGAGSPGGHWSTTTSFLVVRKQVASKKPIMGIEIVYYDRFMSNLEVLSDLDRRGQRPTNVEETQSFGAAHPDEQLKHRVVGLVCDTNSPDEFIPAPVLTAVEGKRTMILYSVSPESGWSAGTRFLAVSK